MQKISSLATAASMVWAFFANTPVAYGEECAPLKIVASVGLLMAPGDRAAFAPVTLQGQTRYMLIDTGGVMSMVTPGIVAELGLESVKTRRIRFYDVKGNYVNHATVVPDFAIGGLKAQDAEFVIGPDMFKGKIAGILAPNILRFYDVSLDFANRNLTLLSPDHCPGKVIYWKADTVAVVPVKVARANGHIEVPVVLDGHKLTALIDTGATNSVLNLNVAEDDFGLRTGRDMTPVRALGNPGNSTVYRHAFHSLNIEGIAVMNPAFYIIPDLERGKIERPPPTGTRIADPGADEGLPDMLIGMDILQHLHLYIAYKEQKLYITPASQGAAARSPASGVPAAPGPTTTASPAH